jgi:hypothetical protein
MNRKKIMDIVVIIAVVAIFIAVVGACAPPPLPAIEPTTSDAPPAAPIELVFGQLKDDTEPIKYVDPSNGVVCYMNPAGGIFCFR